MPVDELFEEVYGEALQKLDGDEDVKDIIRDAILAYRDRELAINHKPKE